MPLYALISPADNPALEKAVAEKFKDRFFKIAPGQFVISTETTTTTQNVYEQMGIKGGGLGSVLVLPITNYSGWHSQNLWEWLAAQSKPPTTATG
jgi:hypothetical protein